MCISADSESKQDIARHCYLSKTGRRWSEEAVCEMCASRCASRRIKTSGTSPSQGRNAVMGRAAARSNDVAGGRRQTRQAERGRSSRQPYACGAAFEAVAAARCLSSQHLTGSLSHPTRASSPLHLTTSCCLSLRRIQVGQLSKPPAAYTRRFPSSTAVCKRLHLHRPQPTGCCPTHATHPPCSAS